MVDEIEFKKPGEDLSFCERLRLEIGTIQLKLNLMFRELVQSFPVPIPALDIDFDIHRALGFTDEDTQTKVNDVYGGSCLLDIHSILYAIVWDDDAGLLSKPKNRQHADLLSLVEEKILKPARSNLDVLCWNSGSNLPELLGLIAEIKILALLASIYGKKDLLNRLRNLFLEKFIEYYECGLSPISMPESLLAQLDHVSIGRIMARKAAQEQEKPQGDLEKVQSELRDSMRIPHRGPIIITDFAEQEKGVAELIQVSQKKNIEASRRILGIYPDPRKIIDILLGEKIVVFIHQLTL